MVELDDPGLRVAVREAFEGLPTAALGALSIRPGLEIRFVGG